MEEQNKDREEEKSEPGPQVFGITREKGSFKFSRRDFVRASAVASTAVVLTGCKLSKTAAGEARDISVSKATTTPERTSTITPEDTSTPVPTETEVPTSTATITSTPEPIIGYLKGQGVNLRKGPGTNYDDITTIPPKAVINVIARDSKTTWVMVRVKVSEIPLLAGSPLAKKGPNTMVEGWIRADLLSYSSPSVSELPVKSAPPTPTALPNEKPKGDEGIKYTYTDEYGQTTSYTLSCGSPIPEGAVCTCNCVAVCSCNGYTAPSCSCVADRGDMVCTCDVVSYWYPN